MIKLFLFLTLFSIAYCKEHYCYFAAPKDWEMQLFEENNPVKVGFLGRAKDNSRPNLYLSEEEVDCDLKEYVASVKKIYKNNPKFTFTDIGTIQTKSGKAYLAEIESKTEVGITKMMQLMIIKGKRAYVLTGGNSKKNFLSTHSDFIRIFKSVSIEKNPLAFITDQAKKEPIEKAFKTLKTQQQVAKMLGKLGLDQYSQKLVLDFYKNHHLAKGQL